MAINFDSDQFYGPSQTQGTSALVLRGFWGQGIVTVGVFAECRSLGRPSVPKGAGQVIP